MHAHQVHVGAPTCTAVPLLLACYPQVSGNTYYVLVHVHVHHVPVPGTVGSTGSDFSPVIIRGQ